VITKLTAISNLKKYTGQDLSVLAKKHGITKYKNGKQNKGWKGLTLERLAGLSTDNTPSPNGLDFELKSTSYIIKDGIYKPKETMAITMINPIDLKNTSFYKSHCWRKLKSIVFCAVSWYGKNIKKSELLKVTSFEFLKDEKLIKEIEEDYEFIRKKLINNGFSALTGKDGKWIQARTKEPGHGSISRAFYARKNLLNSIFKF